MINQKIGQIPVYTHHHYNPGATSGSIYIGSADVYGTPSSIMRDGTPKGYAYLEIKNTTYTYEYKASGHPDSYKMSIHVPNIVPRTKKYRGEIVVNFFQGSPRDTLEYRIDKGPWQALEQRVCAYRLAFSGGPDPDCYPLARSLILFLMVRQERPFAFGTRPIPPHPIDLAFVTVQNHLFSSFR